MSHAGLKSSGERAKQLTPLVEHEHGCQAWILPVKNELQGKTKLLLAVANGHYAHRNVQITAGAFAAHGAVAKSQRVYKCCQA